MVLPVPVVHSWSTMILLGPLRVTTLRKLRTKVDQGGPAWGGPQGPWSWVLDQEHCGHQQKNGSLRAQQFLRRDARIAPWASCSPIPPIHDLSILVAPRRLRSNTTWMEYTWGIRRVNSAPHTPEETRGIRLSGVPIGRQTSTLQISSAVLHIPLYSAEVFREEPLLTGLLRIYCPGNHSYSTPYFYSVNCHGMKSSKWITTSRTITGRTLPSSWLLPCRQSYHSKYRRHMICPRYEPYTIRFPSSGGF